MAKSTVNGVSANVGGLGMAKAAYNGMSPTNRAYLPAPEPGNAAAFYNALVKYDAVMNEFLTQMVNRIMMSWVRSAEAYDPLEFLRNEANGPGFSIQETYVDMFDAVDFDMCDDYSEEIFRSETPNVYTIYHSINFQKRVKSTVKTQIMSRAFVDWSAVEDMAARIVGELYESMRDAEYQATKGLLNMAFEGGWAKPIGVSPVNIENVDGAAMRANTVKIRSAIGRMKFASRDYNFMGVKNRTTIDDILFITTPEYISAQDVEVLASSFNMSKSDFLGRVVEVDDFGGAEKKGAVGFIISKEWFKIFRTMTKMSEQYNAAADFINYWYRVDGIFSVSMFQNCAVLVDSSKIDTIESVTVDANQKAGKCKSTLITAKIAAADSGNKYHYEKLNWSVSGANSKKTKVSPFGLLFVGPDETAGTLSLTATSAQDSTKTSTVDVTVTA